MVAVGFAFNLYMPISSTLISSTLSTYCLCNVTFCIVFHLMYIYVNKELELVLRPICSLLLIFALDCSGFVLSTCIYLVAC